MKNYDHKKNEKKWQTEWEKKKIYQAKDPSRTSGQVEGKKFYSLVEFPYPSGDGLHVGHPRPYIGMDIISRKKRMEGKNVLFPMGWDAFGLPAENYAIKTGKQPSVITKKNSDNFRRQIKSLGISFDWSREINTTDPAYYKWTQWLFLQFLKKGLAYKAKSEINWCPSCKIGLANEEVIDGKCERCGAVTVKKEKEQWMLAITKYAERLDKDLNLVDYPERVKSSQRNWIGKSEGSEIDFSIKGGDKIKHIVILHGRNGTPNNYAFPWLKKEFEKRGYTVELPELPNTSEPNDEEQADYVQKHCTLNEDTMIVGQSFGGIVAMRLLERGVKVGRVVLAVVPFSGKFNDKKNRKSATYACKKGFDFKTIKTNAKDFIVLRDIKDTIVPFEDAECWHKNLNGKLINGEGLIPHFSGEKEPDMLMASVPTIRVFTTRADTLFGATYVVLAPEHELIQNLKSRITNWNEVEKYINDVKKKSDLERTENKEKTGVELKGIKAINPAYALLGRTSPANSEACSAEGREIPIFIADYVLAGYGTGAVMAVPAHDERDFEFAKKFNLEIKEVVLGGNINEEAYAKEGKLVNSGDFSGVRSEEAKIKITDFVGGKMVTKFKLRDWVFSRQRYWGEPIPVVNCEKCGLVAVKEKDLPVKLPPVKSYKPTDTGESPLASISKWVNTKCPKCGGKAKRETDTMPNWAGSSWYYLRYTDPKNKKEFASKKNLKYWLGNDPHYGGVDWYNGGMEHTTLHLLYSRFWHKFFYDLKLVPTIEPYTKRTSHGMILGEGGVKMSKSLGNVVNPDEIVKTYGSDTLRVYEMFIGPFKDTAVWNTESIIGSRRFLERVWRIGEKISKSLNNFSGPRISGASNSGQTVQNPSGSLSLQKLLHKTIKKVTEDIELMNFNTAISTMMILVNEIEKVGQIGEKDFKMFLQILAPFAPHITEELWRELGEKQSIHKSSWPKWDENKIIEEEVKIAIQVNGKVRAEILIFRDMQEEEIKEKAKLDERVVKFISGKEIKKVIYVKNRLVNIVI